MAATNSEVSKKIRAAIKAKLEELGVYVDEELPDYIMVMIANKKEKTQMKDDLQLFLGKNSAKFVDWLFDIFDRLQTAGTANPTTLATDISQSKRKETDTAKTCDKSRDEGDEKKRERKRRESGDRAKEAPKDREGEKSRERNKEREKKEKEKERDKYEAKVVKSKPSSSHHREQSPASSHEKTSSHRRSERATSRIHKESATSSGKRDEERRSGGEKVERREERKAVKVKQGERKNDERQGKEKVTKLETKKLREKEKYESPLKKASQASGQHDLAKVSRKRRISPPKSISADIEEKATTHDEPIIKQQPKVSSVAVAKMPQTEQPKTVSSQIVVKRKLPDKENMKQQSGGVKSLFLKAIKEAGETTRIASQSAGYGGAPSHKKVAEPQKPATKDDNGVDVVEDGGIEVDDYGDLEDALVVMPATSSGGDGDHTRSVVHESEECVESEQEIEPQKRRRIQPSPSTKKDEPKFFITMKGQRIAAVGCRSGLPKLKVSVEDVTKESERPKKRRNEANPILAHLNLSNEHSDNRKTISTHDGEHVQKKAKREQKIHSQEGAENDASIASDGAVVSEGSVDSRRTPVWDGQIQLEEDDSSDDEAQIDAVLASAQTISVGFDEVPPTPTLTKPAFFMAQNQSQSNARSNLTSMCGPLASIGGEKLMERCKFWPNCRLEENCIYIHPSKPCGNFPNCHFGDRCLYVHPLCKFDRTCTNPRCPYTHSPKLAVTTAAPTTTTTTVATVAKPATIMATSLNSTIPCKFGGRCANPNCTYKHPKLCRFGERCTNRSCYFRHPKLNSGTVTVAKYKWKASTSI